MNTPTQLDRSEHLNQLLLAQRAVSRILNNATDPVSLCQQVCESLGQTRGYVSIWIGVPNQKKKQVEPIVIAGVEPNPFLKLPITLDDRPTAHGPAGIALRERRAVVFDDLAVDPRFAPWREDLLPSGAGSSAAVPLMSRGQLLGVLVVKARQVEAFDKDEIQLLSDLADNVARTWLALQKEAELASSRENLETLVEAIPDAVFFKDGMGRWLITNSVAKHLFQTNKRPWFGRTDAELAGDLPELKATHESCAISDELAWTARKLSTVEEKVLLPDGNFSFSEVFKQPVFHPDGRRKGLVIVGRDITQRKKQAAEIIRARDFYLNLLENAPALVWRAGTDAKCDWFNAGWLKFTGRKMEQELGDGWAEGVHPEDLKPCVERYLAAFHRCEPFEMEYRLRRHDGEYRWIVDYGKPFQNLDGNFGGYIGYCYDINEQKFVEQEVRAAGERAHPTVG